MTIASWAGMRGVVTLAAALALPADFPQRSRLTFIAFVVIVTLLLQGLTLPMLAKSLDVTAFDDKRDETEQPLIRRAATPASVGSRNYGPKVTWRRP
jgi:CPA1 family monovalent cation:H+ antiporter